MVLRRGRFGVFLLALAATALCLGLLFTTPSDAQTRAESQNSRAVAGDEDCLEFENENQDEAEDETGDEAGENDTDEDTQSDTADTEGDAADQQALQNDGGTTEDRASQDVGATDPQTQDEDSDTNLQGQRVQSQNQSSLQVRNDNTGDFQQSSPINQSGDLQQSSPTNQGGDPQQSLQNNQSGDLQQSLEAGDEGDAGLSSQDTDGTGGGTDANASENGENVNTTGNDNNDTDNAGTQQTQDEEECIIAETVPDEPLLPTGTPAKSGSNATAKNKSGSEKQGKSGGEKQVETEGKTGGKQADSAGKRSGGGKKLEVQDRGKKIEVEDRSGKTARQEKSGSRTSPASSNDARPEKARSGNSSSEAPRSEPARSESSRAESSRTRSVRDSDLAPRLAAAEWSSPSREEVASTERIRRFAPDPGAEMTLSVRAMSLYDVPVANSNRLEELDRGLVRMPDTSLPWDAGDQRNVFVAGHYLGLPDTQSRLVFYNLDKLKSGDEIVLKDSLGQIYKYRVSEKFAAGPEDSWVMGQVWGRDMLTLQTCIPPDFGKRLVVRADRVQ